MNTLGLVNRFFCWKYDGFNCPIPALTSFSRIF